MWQLASERNIAVAHDEDIVFELQYQRPAQMDFLHAYSNWTGMKYLGLIVEHKFLHRVSGGVDVTSYHE